MKKRFFLVSLTITFLGIIIYALISTNVYYNNAISQTKDTLVVYMNQYDESLKFDNTGAKSLSDKLSGARVTFLQIYDIDKVIVVGDSQKEDITQNHSDRVEVIDAINLGYGYSVRNSDSIGKKLIYYALKTTDEHIVRISIPTSSSFKLFYESIPTILIFLFIDLIVCAFISLFAVDLILKPVERMTKDSALFKKVTATYPELEPIADIINRRNKEIKEKIENIKENKKIENMILNNMEHGMAILSKNFRVILSNSVAKSILDIRDNDTIYLDDELKEAMQKGENSIIYRNIDTRDYAFRISVASDAYVILMTDVTKIKNAERSKNDFIANVTHEMNTPLTSIKGFAELIKLQMLDEKTLNHACDVIIKQSNRLSNLIKNIINYSSYEDENIEIFNINISSIIKNTAESLEGGLKNLNLTVNYDIDDDIYIHSREERIVEITTNLVSNAIKYNKQNGSIFVSLKEYDENIIFEVKDTGLGIKEEEIDKIFDRFYTIDKSHNEATSGFGLGLAVVKKICENQKWKIEVESSYGEGSSFRVIMKK